VIDTVRPNSNAVEPSDRDEPFGSAPETRAVDTLFYQHVQDDSDAAWRDSHPALEAASELVSDDLLELLSNGRDADEL
jgi:hypothetical protein